VWLSLLFAAIKTLEGSLLATAVVFLAWIAFGELYRRFRAVGPLVALGGGPVLLLTIWGVVLLGTGAPWEGNDVLPPVRWFQIYALGWGIALSLVVALQQLVGRWVAGRAHRRCKPSQRGAPNDPLPARCVEELRCAAILFAIHTVFALVATAVSWGDNLPSHNAGFLIVMAMDLPVAPVYIWQLRFDFFEMPNIVLASLILGGAVYAAVGVLVGHAVERFRPPAPAASPPTQAPSEVPPSDDGRRS
jgi:hypothetical protein